MSLPHPVTPEGAAGLDAIVRHPSTALLALDFDGVLAPIVADPAQSRAHPGVVPVLTRLAPHLGALAVITGRPAATAVEYGRLSGAEGLDKLVVFGHYGVERWDAATARVAAPPPHPGVAAARRHLADLLVELGLDQQVQVEDKHRSLAVHTRQAPEPEHALERLRGPLDALARTHGLVVEPGRMVIELRAPGMDKGSALTRLAGEVVAGSVAYIGDDLGDLPAFAAVDRLRSQGVAGLKVCAGSDEVRLLAERADLVVNGPDGVVELLDALAELLDTR